MIRLLHFALFFAAVCSTLSCSRGEKKFSSARVDQSIMLAQVPSGSALEPAGKDAYFIVSDDAPFVYRFYEKPAHTDSIPFVFLPHFYHRIPKPEKPDFEASVTGDFRGEKCLVALGSGSVDKVRDSVVAMPTSAPEKQRHFSLTAFYAHIRTQLRIAHVEFNIEGAALHGDKFVLFNRGTDHLILLSWKALTKYLTESAPLPDVSGWTVSLPKVKGYTTGFSGGEFIDETHLLYCASVEATTDWTHDGEVLGSFVGVVEMKDGQSPKLACHVPLLDGAGSPVKDKLESVIVQPGNWPHLIGVVDNDDGTSKLLHITCL